MGEKGLFEVGMDVVDGKVGKHQREGSKTKDQNPNKVGDGGLGWVEGGLTNLEEEEELRSNPFKFEVGQKRWKKKLRESDGWGSAEGFLRRRNFCVGCGGHDMLCEL